MNDEDKKQLEEIRGKLLDITTSPEALDNLPADQRASMLMFQLRNSENPSVGQYRALLTTIEEIEDNVARVDAALDLMGEIDLRTGLLEPADDEGVDTEATSERAEEQATPEVAEEHHNHEEHQG